MMMETPQSELHDYISEISEHAEIQMGSPLPVGTQERGGGVIFAIFSENYGIHENEEDRLYLMFNAGLGGDSV
jgi:hypothetical protein